MSTDIRQLKKDNEVFYPQTHIKGVIGLDDELATKANIDGYYESMGVGIADDLKGDIDTPSQFIYRITGGDTEANTGTANVSLFKGNTVKFNQLVQNGDFAKGTTGWTSTFEASTPIYSVSNGVLTMEKNAEGGAGNWLTNSLGQTFDATHKYYLAMTAWNADNNTTLTITFYNSNYTLGTNAKVSTSTTTPTRVSTIGSPQTTGNGFSLTVGSAITPQGTVGYFKDIMIIDLTLIFGLGNEPNTAAEFESLFPLDYYDYTPGKLLSFGGYSIKWNQLVNTNTTSVPTTSGYKYLKVVSNVASIVASTGSDITGLTGGVDQVFDLTTMFGKDNEPSQTQFEAWFLQGSTPSWSTTYYPYNAGEVKNILEATNQQLGIETIGFNQLDESSIEEGCFYLKTGRVSNLAYNASPLIRVMPNVQYYIKNAVGGNIQQTGVYYDVNKTAVSNYYISGGAITSNTITTPDYCHYLRINYNRAANERSLNFHCDRDGTYEPYKKNTLNLDWIKSLEYTPTGSSTPVKMFPDGLLSAGTVYDEINERQVIKRVGVVDLGSLTWSYDSQYQLLGATNQISTTHAINTDILCAKYAPSTAYSAITMNDKTIGFFNSKSGLYVKDTAYTDAATFKTAMKGVMLYYELETPIVIDLDPYATPKNLIVDNKGTERLIPENGSYPVTGAFNGNIRYDINAVETLRNLKTNFISKGSFDNFLGVLNSALGSTMGGTIEYKSSLDENGDYDFELVESTQGE